MIVMLADWLSFGWNGIFSLVIILALIMLLHIKSIFDIVDFVRKPREQQQQQQQSPIDIVRSTAININRKGLLHWLCYDELPPAILLSNNGRTVMVNISAAPDCVPHLSSNYFPGNYYFVEAIFKWGSTEHSIDSRNYVLEMQVLHATNWRGGHFDYVTVSYMFQRRRNYKNIQLSPIVDNLRGIVQPGSVIELPPINLADLIKPFHKDYYSYLGSYDNGNTVLRTLWLMCPNIVYIGANQLAKFRTICNSNGCRIVHNACQLQPINSSALVYNR
ncbi:carbonic anhydrase 4 isoform X2 [Drosophila grimshawi]|uniref:carbonic anhydrase 4 isoform X2 n=1 Tax=Drosophila grimshawi TaxID=7222 RepID=UPI000C86F45F|nr:carbonic anhydrase 4 isoform X2 [Drosophila grimshawi]